MSNRTVRLAAATLSVGVLLTPIMASSAEASGYRLYNSVHSNRYENAGVWSNSTCSGKARILKPGHSATNVLCFKVYSEHGEVIKPNGDRHGLRERHAYKVTGNNWKLKIAP